MSLGRRTALGLAALLALGGAVALAAQDFPFRGRRARIYSPGEAPRPGFTFCRVFYNQVRYEWMGQGWRTDYPDSDRNFMLRFSQLTTADVAHFENNEPFHAVVTLTDDALFECPFIFMSDVGTLGLSGAEADNLRAYLLKGGFLWVDDFWGEDAWEQWTREIGRVLPPAAYPIVDLPLSHEMLQTLYKVDRVPQVPSIQFWRRSGRSQTSERGQESAEPHLRAIFDERGRIMVVMTHNTDIADGWEREGEDDEFFYLFSPPAYGLGVNVVLYALTH
ncbi:MAG: DUF4159 domain-containing protein [Gemmatimonadota bacterium]